MLNLIWLALMVIAVIVGIFNGTLNAVALSVAEQAKYAFQIALGLTGVLTFWLGIMKIAEQAGLIHQFANLLRPVMAKLFPEIPKDHPAIGAMLFNIAANMLGLNNAATPFGLKAMEQLETLNPNPGTATNSMCTFLVMNTASIQIIPTTAIAYLTAAGASQPTKIIICTLFASVVALTVGLITVKFLAGLPRFNRTTNIAVNT